MKAMFIGKDGSLGLRNGHIYKIAVNISHDTEEVTAFSNYGYRFVCPYSNLNNFLMNWQPCAMEEGGNG